MVGCLASTPTGAAQKPADGRPVGCVRTEATWQSKRCVGVSRSRALGSLLKTIDISQDTAIKNVASLKHCHEACIIVHRHNLFNLSAMHPGNTDAGYSYLSPGRLNLVKHPFVNAHKRPKNTHTGTLAEDLIDFHFDTTERCPESINQLLIGCWPIMGSFKPGK